ncbi:hypothetical protein B0T22DRAFT_20611 [Podospora appendiculata]|uniref:Uncharacterized protein n=1 Tax=Podospora appendiculata TaxID=314037 RepID=A0AAE1CFJ0_9PEZI|nr:hypothetical protein B0T22DRAFT_20611 [Podospora appendiculata]
MSTSLGSDDWCRMDITCHHRRLRRIARTRTYPLVDLLAKGTYIQLEGCVRERHMEACTPLDATACILVNARLVSATNVLCIQGYNHGDTFLTVPVQLRDLVVHRPCHRQSLTRDGSLYIQTALPNMPETSGSRSLFRFIRIGGLQGSIALGLDSTPPAVSLIISGDDGDNEMLAILFRLWLTQLSLRVEVTHKQTCLET